MSAETQQVSATTEEAEHNRLREARHARMRLLAQEAMADPDFVADLQETVQALRHADAENWPYVLAAPKTGH